MNPSADEGRIRGIYRRVVFLDPERRSCTTAICTLPKKHNEAALFIKTKIHFDATLKFEWMEGRVKKR